MEWTGEAIVLSARPHGETGAVLSLLTAGHGRHSGLLPGGRSARRRAALEPGSVVNVRWRARLAEHLGTLTVEPLRQAAAVLLDDPLRLAGLVSMCAVAEAALPEREPHPAVYRGCLALLDQLESADAGEVTWGPVYVRWELGLLGELGFGLDLSACAVSGMADDLAYVSPRTGRAVSAAAGKPYADRLLRLPGFLVGRPGTTVRDVLDGLALTGWFLERQAGVGLPAARQRLVERFHISTKSGSLDAS